MGNVGIIGLFGGNTESYDGQTVKTKNLKKLLDTYTDFCITEVDTWYFRKNPIKLLMETILCLLKCKHIFLLVSVNGMNFYLRFFYVANKIFNRHIYHYIIGSELLNMVEKNQKLVKYLNSLDVNWFEYESGTRFLKENGVTNAYTLPNMKMITPVTNIETSDIKNGTYKFCTFSRVMKEKGITDAIEAAKRINCRYGFNIISLDIYGQIHHEYKDEFLMLIEKNKEFVTYKGVVDSFSSVDILKKYYALLFPTKWPGEGVPGTIIDSFAAGIPVIATDWNANKEILEHNKQGIIYPNKEMSNLEEAILWAINNSQKMEIMREESRKEFQKYKPESIFKIINEKMKENDRE